MSKRTIAVATVAACLTLAATAAASGKHPATQLSGTWIVNVSLVNPPPGVDANFQALDTFVPGGGILVSSSQGHPTARSLAHGNCAHAGGRQYTCTFVWFRFDPTGAYVGMQRVRRTMTVSPALDSFEATDTVEVLAPDGTVVASLQGTESGRPLGA